MQDALEGTGTGDRAEGIEDFTAREVASGERRSIREALATKGRTKGNDLERKIESERSSYRYLNSSLRETEEELADVKETSFLGGKKKRKKKLKLIIITRSTGGRVISLKRML